jgi:hypothetical protein
MPPRKSTGAASVADADTNMDATGLTQDTPDKKEKEKEKEKDRDSLGVEVSSPSPRTPIHVRYETSHADAQLL